jgi:hypothetical protein
MLQVNINDAKHPRLIRPNPAAVQQAKEYGKRYLPGTYFLPMRRGRQIVASVEEVREFLFGK